MRYGEDEGGHGSWYEQVTPEGDRTDTGGPADPASMRGRPPQWYPDPLAPDTHHRWWTGTGWSTHTHPPDGPLLPEAHTRTQRPTRPLRRLLVAVAAVAAVVIALTVATHLVNGLDRTPPDVAATTGANPPAHTPLSSPPPAGAASPTSTGAPAHTPGGTGSVPAATGWLLVPGVPAQARTVCAAGSAAGGSPSSTAPIRCTFQNATQSGTVTCAPDADQPAGAVTTCTVTDELSDRSTRSSCSATPAGLTCTPAARLDVLTR